MVKHASSPEEVVERLITAAAFRNDMDRLQALLKTNFERAGLLSDEDVYD